MAPFSLSSGYGLATLVLCGLAIPVVNAAPKSTLVLPGSKFFSTSFLEYSSSVNVVASDGDLWPTTWADDDNIYTANGDGRGFSTDPNDFADIVVNRISGTPEGGITGARLAAGDAVGPVWTDPAKFNRKPTGIIAVDGDGDGKDELYLVMQDLSYGPNGVAFNEVPAASVLRSTDYGATWTPTQGPMFTNHIFTTVFFLDFGKSNSQSSVLGGDGSKYVYAYGFDNNWRDSVNNAVPDPTDVYLARVPIASIQDVSKWEFFSGTPSSPAWEADIQKRKPVLSDTSRVYPGGQTADGYSVISQGSVVYNAPLKRYLYTSWTDYSFNFYEAPQPWGPFTLFEYKDFGVTPWFGQHTPTPKNGGYTTTIPSKFISADGNSMWVQSNWFVGAAEGSDFNYCFSLRRLDVTKYVASKPSNKPGDTNLATAKGTVPVCKAAHYGHLQFLNDKGAASEDSWDGSIKETDRWGYIWSTQYNMNRVVYTTGDAFPDGGWFASDLKVQVRKNFEWVDVEGLQMDPAYPYDASATPGKAFTLSFENIAGDGIQIIGAPGGSATFTSIRELEVYYDA